MATRDVFAGLDPAPLWSHFSDITAIPRPSGNETAIAEYIAGWAGAHGFLSRRDAAGNTCVYVPPSNDAPGQRVVALQAHLDMVCVRADQSPSDPAKGQIEIAREGPWIVAPSSTLGADNGIGVATAMSIAESEVTPHGPLELLFTVDEERTCKGADALDPSLIHSGVMVNLDAEASDALLVGCAGGAWTVLRWPAPTETPPDGWLAADIAISGLQGGHSGIDIGKNRLNAIKGIVWTIRRALDNVIFRLCTIEGGNAFNSLPICAHATIAFPSGEDAKLVESLAAARIDLGNRFAHTDPGLSLSMVGVDPKAAKCWNDERGRRFLDLLAALPSGVIAMEQHAPDLVETSNNLGIVVPKHDAVEVHCFSRSCVASALEETVASIQSAARLAGAHFAIVPPVVPPWRVAPDSAALATVRAAYRDHFNQDPRLVTIHAGTESAIIQQRIPGLDIVSLGPEIHGVHTPGERVNVASVADFYRLLGDVLQRMAR